MISIVVGGIELKDEAVNRRSIRTQLKKSTKPIDASGTSVFILEFELHPF